MPYNHGYLIFLSWLLCYFFIHLTYPYAIITSNIVLIISFTKLYIKSTENRKNIRFYFTFSLLLLMFFISFCKLLFLTCIVFLPPEELLTTLLEWQFCWQLIHSVLFTEKVFLSTSHLNNNFSECRMLDLQFCLLYTLNISLHSHPTHIFLMISLFWFLMLSLSQRSHLVSLKIFFFSIVFCSVYVI